MSNGDVRKTDWVTGFLAIVLMVSWPIGLYHSWHLHSNTDFFMSLFPLWGAYRGFEMLWH